jgi:RsiW-degrading membrane proteinase PrsW (M82 family)
MNNLHLALLGAVPALIAMVYVDRLDAKRPEPRRTLRRVAIAGALGAFPVLIVGGLLEWIGSPSLALASNPSSYAAAFYTAFVVAAIPEEASKLVSMLLFAWRRPEFDERMDGIVYGARAGLGFALLENVAYLLIVPASFGEYLTIFAGRALLAVPGHATWGGIIGYFAAKRRFDDAGPGLLGGYLLAVVLHGSYDAVLMASPIALTQDHHWPGLGVTDVPIVSLLAPVLIIAIGALVLRRLAAQAIAADDRAHAAAPYVAAAGTLR